jgi:NitT/TauT family transport system permease protein
MVSKRFLYVFVLLLLLAAVLLMKSDAILLPYFVALSTGRMAIAYIISLVFSLIFGIWMAQNKKAFRYLLPFMDMLQSVPILGFLQSAQIFLKTIPFIGSEAATIFLIFSCMAWSTLFNVVEGVRMIPQRIKDLSQLMGLKGIGYLTHVVIPAIKPQIISGAIAGWGGGWYFLVVGEFTTFGSVLHELPGIGQFIAESAYSGDIALSLLGIWALAAVVLLFNRFVWTPLQERTESYWATEDGEPEEESRIADIIEEIGEQISGKLAQFFGWLDPILIQTGADPKTSVAKPSPLYSIFLTLLVVAGIALVFIFYQSDLTIGKDILKPIELFWYSLDSIRRILIAYVIALTWTLVAGLVIGRNRKLRSLFMPIFDIGQSIPAVAVFPIIVVAVVTIAGGSFGVEIASILLLLTGMQWYLLFNILRAMQSIPSNILEIGTMLDMKYIYKLRHIILPAIFPAVVAGSIQAIGGGWNATIISEYIVYKTDIYTPDGGGLGWLLNIGTAEGNSLIILCAVLSMVIIIIGTDKLVWARALKRAEKYKWS